MFTFPLLLTVYAGFTHAFEADHLLAVSNIVSRRNNIKLSLKDGIFWGLGHASAIFFIGLLMILVKVNILEQYFNYFEAGVGVMLVTLGCYRLIRFYQNKKNIVRTHSHVDGCRQHRQLHVPVERENKQQYEHSVAYGVGLVHGIAGSGALVAVVMSQMKGPADGLTYLLLFAAACIAGMMLAAGFFSIPFSKKMVQGKPLHFFLIITSSLLCLLYGGKVIYENLVS